jgi:hypothetical protein
VSENRPTTTTTNNQSLASLQQQQFLTYADPQSRFSIDYPSNWTAKPAANRFSSSLVEFVSPAKGLNFADVDIRVIKNMPFGVESAFNIVLPSLRTSIPNFELNEGPNCDKYTTADGNQACYLIYTRTSSYLTSIKFAVEVVGVKVGSDIYLISYTTFPDFFDKNLPIADQMISSFRGTG